MLVSAAPAAMTSVERGYPLAFSKHHVVSVDCLSRSHKGSRCVHRNNLGESTGISRINGFRKLACSCGPLEQPN